MRLDRFRSDPTTTPDSIRVLRTLGHGRAARAQLVEATMPDGRALTCVEKVFAPGRLTRAIYRLSFQAPFAYQSNRDAILACFYRRRVAAAVLAASDVDALIAWPHYVRFDQNERSWVLAAEWIDGRGIKPAAADCLRIRRRHAQTKPDDDTAGEEIDQLVDTMRQLESILAECGLVGSGWQVAPRALVSTANLLRIGDRYTIIDLESGIPAVLVPRYLIAGAGCASLPPFDDIDTCGLRTWIEDNERLLTFRIGPDAVSDLRDDSERLIHHCSRWKNAELALFRSPRRLYSRVKSYRRECLRRWKQDDIVDDATASALPSNPIQRSLIWCAGLLPSTLGRVCSRIVGHRDFRDETIQFLRSSDVRSEQIRRLIIRRQSEWRESGRLAESTRLTRKTLPIHLFLQTFTPAPLHRFLTDRRYRRNAVVSMLLLLSSPRYQSWFGQSMVEAAIDGWHRAERISDAEADQLRSDLQGNEVRAYTRGFGMHFALKAFAPLIVPAKVGGLAAFFTAGNPWFLLPMLATPILRTAITLANWWTTRQQHVPHGEAIATSWLPMLGSIAFPLQMFSTRPRLSTFLVRDAASKLGQRLPVYGGRDSRTEIALIRSTDYLVEIMEMLSGLAGNVLPTAARSQQGPPVLIMPKRSRFGRWIDERAARRISEQSASQLEARRPQVAESASTDTRAA